MSFLQGSFQSIASAQIIFIFFAIYINTVQGESDSDQPLHLYSTLTYGLRLVI